MTLNPWFLLAFAHCTSCFRINLSGGHKHAELPRFWTSTGFSPRSPVATSLSSEDVRQSLVLLSSMPRNGLYYVRTHWVFDLISFK